MELNTQLQKRTIYQPTGLIVREVNEGQHYIEGVAVVTNVETTLWEGPEWREIEIIDPSCITPEFIASQDIKQNLLHVRELSFARNNKGVGTLQLETTEEGLAFRTPLEDCDLHKRAYALVKNKTYTGNSFEFYAGDYTINEREGADGKTEYVIRHTRFDRITAITVGLDPAYQQTSVNAREIYNEIHAEEQRERPEVTTETETDEERENREADEAAAKAAQERKLADIQRAIAQHEREIEILRQQQMCNN